MNNLKITAGLPWVRVLMLASLGVVAGLMLVLTISIRVS
jgi:hypothetical protein